MARSQDTIPYKSVKHNPLRKTGAWYYDPLVKRPSVAQMLASFLSPEDQPVLVEFTTKNAFLNPRGKVIPIKIMTMGKDLKDKDIVHIDGVWTRPDGQATYLASTIHLNNQRPDHLTIVDAIGLQLEYVE